MKRLLILLCLLLTSPVWATTRYVAPAGLGGSDSNSCAASATIGTPKMTIQSAQNGMGF